MTKMGCLKAFPDPGRRRRWWKQKMQCLLLWADLLPTGDRGQSFFRD